MNAQDWDCWDEYNHTAFTLYEPRGALLLCRLPNLEAPAFIHQRTLDNLDHTCLPSKVDCHFCGRKTITSQNVCSLSISHYLIKKYAEQSGQIWRFNDECVRPPDLLMLCTSKRNHYSNFHSQRADSQGDIYHNRFREASQIISLITVPQIWWHWIYSSVLKQIYRCT